MRAIAMKLPPISRRNLLRAAGVTLALPVLERFAPHSRADDSPKPIRRMVCMNTTLGIHPENFFPKTPGKDYEATPYLKTLNDFRDHLTVFSGVSHPDVDGGHSAEASFL